MILSIYIFIEYDIVKMFGLLNVIPLFSAAEKGLCNESLLLHILVDASILCLRC